MSIVARRLNDAGSEYLTDDTANSVESWFDAVRLRHIESRQEQPRPAYRPKSAKTLLSDKQLELHGLCFHDDPDAQSWIVPLDADNLVDEPASQAWMAQVVTRVDELRALAAEEGLPFSDDSASEAIGFAQGISAARRPSAFLVGNGNIRLLWTHGDEQIGLQFRGQGIIQYVMFVRRGEQVASHMGADNAATILRQISALGLRHLLKA